MFYISKYITYCAIINFLKLNKKKKLNYQIFIDLFLQKYKLTLQGFLFFLFNLTIFYKQLFAYMWLYYNEENLGIYFINKLNLFFKKKII